MLAAFRSSVVVLLVVASFAGCLGGDEASGSGAVDESPSGVEAASLDESPNMPPVEEEEAPQPPAPVSVDVAFEGETGTFVCVFSQALSDCQGEFSQSSARDLEYVGTPLTLTGTLTWERTSATGERLQVNLFERVDGAVEFNASMPSKEGTSPLAVEFDLAPFAGRALVVDVSSYLGQESDGANAGGSMAQSFRFEGVLTYVPDS